MPKKLHPADEAALREIAEATSFVATLFLGRGQYAKRFAATLAWARAEAKYLIGEHPNSGRLPMIYAILPNGRQVFVPSNYQQPETTMSKSSKKSAPKSAPKAEAAPKRGRKEAAANLRAAKAARRADAPAANAPALEAPATAAAIRKAAAAKPAPNAIAAQAAAQLATDMAKTAAILAADAAKAKGGKKAGAKKGAAKAAPAPAATAPKAPQAAPAGAKKAKAERASTGKRAAILAAAEGGKLPEPPDFSAATHERFRPKLADLVKMAKEKDLKALRAWAYPGFMSTSPKAMQRYRDLCIVALEAQAKKGK